MAGSTTELANMHETEFNNSRYNHETRFHCREIVLGRLLGTGAFCDVHDLHDVHLLNRKELDQRRSPINEGNEQQRRERIHETCRDSIGISRYVVKHLRANLNADRGVKIFHHAAVDCLKEFEILSRLSHQNIVQLWGSSVLVRRKDNGCKKDYGKIIQENNPHALFIILEKVNDTLSQRILRWILTTKTHISKRYDRSVSLLPPFYIEKLRYARDMASALAHIHNHGMVFRDLKPDNVGIASNGTAKLFDFGLCRDLPPAQKRVSSWNNHDEREPIYRMSVVGTRRYMSPEMISGKGYNQKTDTYSWAMVFYEMLSLQKPYAKYNRELHKKLVCEQKGRPHASTNIPWNSRDLLKRSWGDDISNRPTMRQACNELGQMIDTVEQQALPLIERSLMAILEMSALFGFGNEKTLSCISSDVIPCSNEFSGTEEICVHGS